MKKLIALLLSLVMLLSMAACGSEEPKQDDGKKTLNTTAQTNCSEDNRETEPTQPSDTNDDSLIYSQNNDFWGMKAMNMPQIPALTWEEKPIGNTTLYIATTPFDYDVDRVYDGLKSNEYLGSLYGEFVTSYTEHDVGEYFTDLGEQIAYGKSISFEADLKSSNFYSLKSVGDFRVSYYRSTADYANYQSASMTFTFEQVKDIDQEKILEVAELVFGAEYAARLVYALSMDEVNIEDSATVWKADLDEIVQSGDCYYYLKRKIDKHRDTITVSFSVGVQVNPKENVFITYYGLDDTSMYSRMKYSFSDMLPKTFVNTDPLTFHTFGNSYFQKFYPAYVYSMLDFLTLGVYETESGKTAYNYSIQVSGGCTDMSKILSPKLSIEAYLEEENGQINKMEFSVNSVVLRFAAGEQKEGSAYVEAMIQMMQTIYPEMDLSAMSYTEGKQGCEVAVTMEVLGQTLSGTAKIDYNDHYDITLELK